MATITYKDIKGDKVYEVTFHGVDFEHKVPVEIEDELKHATLIRQAMSNPWFEVTGQKGEPVAAFENGEQAAVEGKARHVPKSLTEPTDQAQYLSGYDRRRRAIEEAREARKALAEAERN
jgi:hypothetical protein